MTDSSSPKAVESAEGALLTQVQEDLAQEQEEEVVTFLDRCIAFALLVGPWSYLTVLAQELLQKLLPVKIVNMVVLAGIILFLISVGWLSKRTYRFRMARGRRSPVPDLGADESGRPNPLE